MTLQVLLSYPELSVKNVLKRMFLIAESMHRDSIGRWSSCDKDTAAAVTKSDDEVDRFSLYAIRQLNMAVQNDFILEGDRAEEQEGLPRLQADNQERRARRRPREQDRRGRAATSTGR